MRSLSAPAVWLALVGGSVAALSAAKNPECDRVESLANTGEHKPAVEAMDGLKGRGVRCPRRVRRAAEASRQRLTEADVHLQNAVKMKSRGDLHPALEELRRALEIYPKYYWADRQQRELEQAIAAELSRARAQATEREAAGDSQAALTSLQRVSALAPADAELATEVSRLRRRVVDENLERAREADRRGDLEESRQLLVQAMEVVSPDPDSRRDLVEAARLLGLKLFSDGELTQARDLWERALALDPANPKLREYLQQVDSRLKSLEQIKAKEPGSSSR